MAGRRPRRTTAKGDRSRERIVAEATRVFARDGYRSGSLAAIAEASGLTLPGLLHYFGSKAELLLAVVTERDRRTEEFIEGRGAPGNALDTFVDAVRHNSQEPHLVELMTVLSAESTSPEHPTHEWFVGRYERLVARLARGAAAEQEQNDWAGSVDPELAAQLLVALADGLRLQRLLGRPELDRADVLEEFLRWMRGGKVGD